MNHRSATVRRAFAVALAATVAGLMLVLPAAAAPLVRELQSGGGIGSEELCGEDWSVESSFAGLFMLKAGRHGDPTPFYFNNESYRNVYTDPADPTRGFIVSGHALFRDLSVTLVSGTVYRFESIQVGQPTVISSLDGRIVARDRGRLGFSFLVDTKGSSNPDDYELLESGPATVAGPHPIGDAMCDYIAEALGD